MPSRRHQVPAGVLSPVRPLRCILPAVPPDCIVSFPSPRVFPPTLQAGVCSAFPTPQAGCAPRPPLPRSLAPPSSPSHFLLHAPAPRSYGAVCLPLRCRAEWQERLPPPQTAPAHNPRGDTTMHFLPVPLLPPVPEKGFSQENRFRQLSFPCLTQSPHFPQFGHLPVAVRLSPAGASWHTPAYPLPPSRSAHEACRSPPRACAASQ